MDTSCYAFKIPCHTFMLPTIFESTNDLEILEPEEKYDLMIMTGI